MTRKEVDNVVYVCREDGDDTTYDIVNTAIQVYLDTHPTPAALPVGERKPLKVEFTKEWCMAAAEREAGQDVTAGVPVGELTDKEIVAAARTLCKQHSAACGVDNHDAWTFYSDDFKRDAREVLEAVRGIQKGQP